MDRAPFDVVLHLRAPKQGEVNLAVVQHALVEELRVQLPSARICSGMRAIALAIDADAALKGTWSCAVPHSKVDGGQAPVPDMVAILGLLQKIGGKMVERLEVVGSSIA